MALDYLLILLFILSGFGSLFPIIQSQSYVLHDLLLVTKLPALIKASKIYDMVLNCRYGRLFLSETAHQQGQKTAAEKGPIN